MRSNSFPGGRPAVTLFSLGLLAMLALGGCSREPASGPATAPAPKDAVGTEHTRAHAVPMPDASGRRA